MTTQGPRVGRAGAWLASLVRACTFHSPVRKGTGLLAQQASRALRGRTRPMACRTRDGRTLVIDPSSQTYFTVYFLGEYERAVTRLVTSLVKPGDTCLDIGANIGWYTTLLARVVGGAGAVHAFEPVPDVFARLVENWRLNDAPSNVHLNASALGTSAGTAELHVFAGLPEGHSSISTLGRADYATVPCPMTTLDAYLHENGVGRVDFIKMDVEGAELQCLEGAGRVFEQDVPPVWMIEMALATTSTLGYGPNDLIEFMRARADYRFYAIDEGTASLRSIEGFGPADVGANVLCVPRRVALPSVPGSAVSFRP